MQARRPLVLIIRKAVLYIKVIAMTQPFPDKKRNQSLEREHDPQLLSNGRRMRKFFLTADSYKVGGWFQ